MKDCLVANEILKVFEGIFQYLIHSLNKIKVNFIASIVKCNP